MTMKCGFAMWTFAALAAMSVLNACAGDAASVVGKTPADKVADLAAGVPKAGLELWLSAGSVEQANGTVTALKDLSGLGNDAKRDPANAAPAANPAVVNGAGGQPVLKFTGDNIGFAFRQITDIRTTFWVVSKDPAAFGKLNEKFVLGDKASNDFHAGWTNDVILNTDVNPGHLSQNLKDAKAWLNGQSIVANKTPFPKQLSVITLVSTGPVKAGQLAKDRNMGGRSWQGEIAEILVYNVELSDVDRKAVEKYLLTKYAISATGPATQANVPPRAPATKPAAATQATATPGNDYAGPFDAKKAGLTPLFDGKTLAGWVGDPNCWKVVDGAIVGTKGNQNLMTVGDYDDFRIVVSTIQVKDPSNHQGIGFWGDHMPEGKYGYGNCVDVMPPMNWTWDYTVNRGAPGKLTLSRDLDKELGFKRSQWTQAEILANKAKGTIRMAVNGVEMLNYVDDNPSRLKKGPIGLQAHAGNQDVRYKDIFVEVAPKDDKLITVK